MLAKTELGEYQYSTMYNYGHCDPGQIWNEVFDRGHTAVTENGFKH